MRILRTLAAIATAATAALAIATPGVPIAAANMDSGVLSALNSVTNGLVQQAAPSTIDPDSAAQTAAVDVPFDPTKGVTLKQDGNTTVVGLPDAAHLSRGVRQASGVVVYYNLNGSDAVVVPTSGGVQLLTVIENANASEDYAYPLTLSAGQRVQVTSGGYALVLDSTGKPVSSIAVPWAVGKSGNVATSFTTNGTTLVQHIAHKASGTKYPVVGDPNVARYSDGVVITFNHWDTGVVGATIAFTPIWIAAATLSGQDGNKLYNAIWYIQAIAAYDGAVTPSLCLWIWVPYSGDKVSAGGYRC